MAKRIERFTVELELEHRPGSHRLDQTLVRGKPVILRSGRNAGTPYLYATVVGVHVHGCPCTRLGKTWGPCSCGAHAMFEAWLAGVKFRKEKR